MRRLLTAALFSLALSPALALAQPAPPDAPPGPGGWGQGPSGMAGHHWKHGKGDWDHHDMGGEMLMKFYAANTTHDGHLTLGQAQAAGLKPIVDHFSEIDTAKRGYVTFYDIEAWRLDDMAKHMEAEAAALRAKD